MKSPAGAVSTLAVTVCDCRDSSQTFSLGDRPRPPVSSRQAEGTVPILLVRRVMSLWQLHPAQWQGWVTAKPLTYDTSGSQGHSIPQ